MVFHEDARRVPLSRFRLHRGERFRYEYDFTAGWALELRLEQILPSGSGRAIPVCTAGRRRRRPRTAAELGTIWNVWTRTGVRLSTSPSWPRRCSNSSILAEIARPSAIELREAVERVAVYQEFKPERFERCQANRKLQAMHREAQS